MLRNSPLRAIEKDRSSALREAVDAFMKGEQAHLAEKAHRDLIAKARRSLLYVVR